MENNAYFVNADIASRKPAPLAIGCIIADYRGTILTETKKYSETIIAAKLDIEGLRTAKNQVLLRHHLLNMRTEAYARIYQKTFCLPPNSYTGQNSPKEGTEFLDKSIKNLQSLQERGILTLPSPDYKEEKVLVRPDFRLQSYAGTYAKPPWTKRSPGH